MLTNLSGRVEKITYENEENGFTIARVKVKGQWGLATVVGYLMGPAPGETIQMKGEWTSHPKYGEQFKVHQYKIEYPATVNGIKRYLGSGLIRGIGPVMADRIVKKFDKQTLHVIENQTERFLEIDGIGKKRIAMIKKAWGEQKEIRDLMIFLQSHGLGSSHAAKIFKTYGDRSIPLVKSNPFRLASDIFGIGFLTADRISEKLGFPKNSPDRIDAGILYLLAQSSDKGHVYCPLELLVDTCRETLAVTRPEIVSGIERLAQKRKIIIGDMPGDGEEAGHSEKGVYLIQLFRCETGVANRLKMLLQIPKPIIRIDSKKELVWVQKTLAIHFAREQVEAVKRSLENKVMIITGGPGTGKTTIIRAILKIFSKFKAKILLAAPTGRAAKRMSEATGHSARTIHRVLEFSIKSGGFQRHEERPLDCHLIVVDEASMIDVVLMHHFLKAVPGNATLILVGDVDQLPSVGPGNVLKDIIESSTIPLVRLDKIFRQAQHSQIIVNAHRINTGLSPVKAPTGLGVKDADFFFINQEDPEKVLQTIIKLSRDRIPQKFGFAPMDDIQVLTPMHKGVVGSANLNRELQQALNPREDGIMKRGSMFCVGDKVMQIRNNYDKVVFNGDIGRITEIQRDQQQLIVHHDGRPVPYDFTDLDQIVLAYAISVHKSQGSEYPAIVMPVLTQHYILLQRNLLYTAVTRGQKLVVMVGTQKALMIAVRNNKTQKRFTHLKHRLL